MPRDFCLKDILNNEFGQDKPKNARVGSLVSNMITGPFAPLANPNVSKEKGCKHETILEENIPTVNDDPSKMQSLIILSLI
jgi:hypothetical protein